MPQKVVTLLFTDIESSTKLWEAFGDGMRQALPRHDALVKKAVEKNGGSVFKTVGDGLCCSFPTPASAVKAAVELQIALNKVTWPVPDFRVRCAIHTGTVDARGGDFYGVALSRVARMLQVCYGGQTLISESSRNLMDGGLPDGAWLHDHGPQRLKDLESPEHLYELRHSCIPVEIEGLRSRNERPNNLPEQVTSFIGRDDLIKKVEAALERSRLITLVGPGGCGKTRLSLQVAGGLLDDYRDGVWFIEFGTVTDPALTVKALASVLNVREQAGSTLEQALVEFAEHRNLLLILDNCEHVSEECGVLADLILKNCPDAHILATSRASLGITGELIFRVPSLSVPKPIDDFDTARSCESVTLFVDRAQLADPSFQLSANNYRSVCRIAERLDGIPLAIELAAARVATMPVEALSARLDDSFRILTGGGRTSLPRQQTLRTMIDWSFNLLSEPEKAMMRRLSVFSNGWTLESAEQVCADGELISEDDVLDLLLQLVGKSLVAYDEISSRYRLLETVRWYSLQKLADADEATQTRDRHLMRFINIAEGAKLTGPDQVEALERLAMEHENILAALDWCDASTSGAESALKIVSALGRFWYMHGHFSTGRKVISVAVSRADAQLATASRAEALVAAALLARVQGDLVAAEGYLREAQDIYKQLDDDKGVSTTLNSLGNVMREGGRYDEANDIWNEALELRTIMGDRAGISVVRGNLGIVAMLRGDFITAEEHILASLATERELQRRSHEGIALSNLGLLKLWQGDLISAKNYCLLALEVNQEVGTKLVESRDLHHLAQISVGLGEFEKARTYLAASFRISWSLAAKELIADALETAAAVLNRDKNFSLAAVLSGAAERVRQESGCRMPPNEEERYSQEVSTLTRALGRSDAGALMERGRAMKTSEAVETALAALSPRLSPPSTTAANGSAKA